MLCDGLRMCTRLTLSHDVIKHIHSILYSARTSQDKVDSLCIEWNPLINFLTCNSLLNYTMTLSVRCCIEARSLFMMAPFSISVHCHDSCQTSSQSRPGGKILDLGNSRNTCTSTVIRIELPVVEYVFIWTLCCDVVES